MITQVIDLGEETKPQPTSKDVEEGEEDTFETPNSSKWHIDDEVDIQDHMKEAHEQPYCTQMRQFCHTMDSTTT